MKRGDPRSQRQAGVRSAAVALALVGRGGRLEAAVKRGEALDGRGGRLEAGREARGSPLSEAGGPCRWTRGERLGRIRGMHKCGLYRAPTLSPGAENQPCLKLQPSGPRHYHMALKIIPVSSCSLDGPDTVTWR